VVNRTARVGLRVTRAQRRRCFALLASAGDVWACVLEVNGWRRRRGGRPLAGYLELCREQRDRYAPSQRHGDDLAGRCGDPARQFPLSDLDWSRSPWRRQTVKIAGQSCPPSDLD
jgi:hypothetical protein